MHPILQLKNLTTLPLHIRRVATAAVDGSDLAWIQITTSLLDQPDIPPQSFLPVLFARLDPTRIPDVHGLDDEDSPLPLMPTMPMTAALCALQSLSFFGALPLPVYQQLWPRIWRWIEFLEAHQHFWPRHEGEDPFILELSIALYPFLKDAPELTSIIHATPGVHAFVNRVWRSLPLAHPQEPIVWLCGFLRGCDGKGLCSTDLIEEHEQNPGVLTSLFLQHANLALRACKSLPRSTPSALLIRNLGDFLKWAYLTRLDELNGDPSSSAGLVRLYTDALAFSSSHPDLGVQQMSVACVDSLCTILTTPRYTHLPRSLRRGLLQSLRALGQVFGLHPLAPRVLLEHLRCLLPHAMVYYPVVCAVARTLPEVLEMPDRQTFRASPIFEAWSDFITLAQKRVRDLQYFHSPEYTPKRACDNPRASVHQDSYLSKRDDAFMRLILLREYKERKLEVLRQQLDFMFGNDGATDFCTEFDFSGANCVIAVKAATLEFLAVLPAATDDTGSELTSPAPTASSAFRHTSHLLAGVFSALLVDKTEWIMTHYDMAFSTISRAAYVSHIETPDATQLDIERLQVSRRWDAPKAKQFFERGAVRVAIASLADHGQPGSGAIIWGMVNDRRDREEELGWLIPVLNWAMCEEYENTFMNDDGFTPEDLSSEEKKTAEQLEDTLLSRRALPGTLIALTFIHEAMHSYVHWRLADAIDPTTFKRIFNTTDEKGKPDPGWLLESHLFHGSFQVQLALANIKNIGRFTQIEDVYLQDRDTVDSFRLIRKCRFIFLYSLSFNY
ncbi:hypothetical protein C8R46DRAFT_1357123 [Mycena filopes]|nr:hypothetical protein C8R46DRAFT_1357123 [Mycena filopes]